MRSVEELKRSAREALAYLEAQEDVVEAEVFVAANGHQLTRLHYTSGIPCNGVEEPKSTENFGLGVTIALRAEGEGPARVGFGSEAGDLSIDGVSEALRKAREGAVADPEFYGLPEPSEEGPSLRDYHDPALMELGDADLVETGWRVIDRALRAYQRSEELRIAAGGRPLQGMGLILGGDVTILQERMAVASSKLRAVQHDESTIITSAITSMVEAEESKGSGYETGVRLGEFGGTAGEDAAGASIAQIGGVRAPIGEYRVIFGRQAVSDLLNNLILPSLHASTFYMQGSPFQGKAGQPVLHPSLTLYDDGGRAGAAGAKAITCEGLPTGRTTLIDRGRLSALLCNWYEAQRLRRDPEAEQKLGLPVEQFAGGLTPRNGFRYGSGGGRHFSMRPRIAATNVFVEGDAPIASEDLIRQVQEGLYIGRIWYTYPINGLRAADFTCTVVGDSYTIKEGRLDKPLTPNSIRINDNVVRLFNHVLGVSAVAKPTLVWAADEVIYAPEIACEGVPCSEIAGEFLGESQMG